nr:TPA_asm: hypothetical protein [Dugejap virus 2]
MNTKENHTSMLFAWSSSYRDSRLQKYTHYQNKIIRHLDNLNNSYRTLYLIPKYLQQLTSFRDNLNKANSTFITPLVEQIENIRHLQKNDFIPFPISFLQSRIEFLAKTDVASLLTPFKYGDFEHQKYLTSHVVKFSPCLAMIKNQVCPQPNLRQIIKKVFLSEFQNNYQSNALIQSPTTAALNLHFPNQLNSMLFQNDKPNPIVLDLHKEFQKKMINVDNNFEEKCTNIINNPECDIEFVFVSLFCMNAEMECSDILFESFTKCLSSCKKKNSCISQYFYFSPPSTKRKFNLQSQGFFSVDLKLPESVNVALARLIEYDNGGVFTQVMETLHQFEKNFADATSPLRENPDKMEVLSRSIIGFILFLMVLFTTSDKIARTFAALFFLNSLPRKVVYAFTSCVYSNVAFFCTMFKSGLSNLVCPDEYTDTQYNCQLRYNIAHGIPLKTPLFADPGPNYHLHAESETPTETENLFECFSRYLVTLFNGKNKEEVKMEDVRVKRITNLSRIISSSKTVMEMMEKTFAIISETVTDLILGAPDLDSAYKNIDVRIPEWFREIEQFEFLTSPEGTKICSPLLGISSYEKKVKLINLQREGEILFRQLSAMYVKPDRIIRYFELRLARVKELVKGLSASLVGMKSKHEPFAMYIYGKPGIGKSILVDFLLKDMYGALGEDFDFVRDKYMKSDITPFWEGYDHQKVYVIDDIFQNRDVDIRTTQMDEAMHIGSRCPFPLNMADCQSKGTVNFSSETFVVTANNKISETEVKKIITTYDAFKRRFKFFIEAKLKPAYIDGNGRFNITTAVEEVFVRDAYEFIVTRHDGQVLSFEWLDLIFALADAKKIHSAQQRELDLVLENSATDMRQKYLKYRQERYNEELPNNDIQVPVNQLPSQLHNPTIVSRVKDFWSIPYVLYKDATSENPYFGKKYNLHSEGISELMPKIIETVKDIREMVYGRTQYAWCQFSFNPRIVIENESAIDITNKTKLQWAANLSEAPSSLYVPTQVREVPELFDPPISTADYENYLEETRIFIPIISGELLEKYERDVCRMTQFKLCQLTSIRIVFELPRFQHIYEGHRHAAEFLDPRFDRFQHDEIVLERYDFVLLRSWLAHPNSIIESDNLRTKYAKGMYEAITFQLNEVRNLNPVDMELQCLRSTVKAYLSHPVFVALGIAASLFSAYKIYKFFSDTDSNKVPKNASFEENKNAWKVLSAEAGSSTSGDQVTKKPRRMRFVSKGKNLVAESNDTSDLEPHPHQCISCERYFAHYHKHLPHISHNTYNFSCPYLDCNFYWKNSPKAPDVAPYGVYPVDAKDVEFIDPELIFPNLTAEAERDPQCMVQMQILTDHTVNVDVVGHCRMRGLIVFGRTVLMPFHAFHNCDSVNGSIVTVEGRLIPSVNLVIDSCVEDREHDLVMFDLPNSVPLKRDITSYFTTEEEYKNSYSDAYIIKYIGNNTSVYQHVFDLKVGKSIDYDIYDKRTNSLTVYYAPHGYVYTSDTAPGDCGSPIVLCDKGVCRKLLGIHVAGAKGVGALVPVTSEWIESHKVKMSRLTAQCEREEINRDYVEEFFDCVDFPIHKDDRIQILGLIPRNLSTYQVTKTAIEPSPIHGDVYPVLTVPALLQRKGKLDPLRNDLVKQCTQEILIPEAILNLAVTDFSNTINALKSKYKSRPELSLHENVNGIKGDDYICSLNFQSAVGFPWPKKFPKLGSSKEKYFPGEIGNKHPIDPIVKAMNIMENKCRSGIVPFVMFHDTLKDERRPLEKVLAGKTRIFSVPPVEFSLLVRKYFLNFVAHLMENHILSEVSVGINPHGDEWQLFFDNTKEVGSNWIAGDYGGYDKRLPYQVCMSALRVVNEFYNDGNNIIRECLGEAMFSSVHFANRVVYQTHHGMPSGVPITAVFNSVVNSILFRVAFITISHENGKDASFILRYLREGIAIRTYGDDHIVRVHKDLPYFNMVSVSNFFSSIGLEYTTTTKCEVTNLYVDENELTYLKRKFVKRRGVTFAPLEMLSIQEMTNWVRKSADPELALIQNIEAACLEMTHYPKSDWDKFYNDLRVACVKKNIAMPVTSFYISSKTLRSGDHSVCGLFLEPEMYYLKSESRDTQMIKKKRSIDDNNWRKYNLNSQGKSIPYLKMVPPVLEEDPREVITFSTVFTNITLSPNDSDGFVSVDKNFATCICGDTQSIQSNQYTTILENVFVFHIFKNIHNDNGIIVTKEIVVMYVHEESFAYFDLVFEDRRSSLFSVLESSTIDYIQSRLKDKPLQAHNLVNMSENSYNTKIIQFDIHQWERFSNPLKSSCKDRFLILRVLNEGLLEKTLISDTLVMHSIVTCAEVDNMLAGVNSGVHSVLRSVFHFLQEALKKLNLSRGITKVVRKFFLNAQCDTKIENSKIAFISSGTLMGTPTFRVLDSTKFIKFSNDYYFQYLIEDVSKVYFQLIKHVPDMDFNKTCVSMSDNEAWSTLVFCHESSSEFGEVFSLSRKIFYFPFSNSIFFKMHDNKVTFLLYSIPNKSFLITDIANQTKSFFFRFFYNIAKVDFYYLYKKDYPFIKVEDSFLFVPKIESTVANWYACKIAPRFTACELKENERIYSNSIEDILCSTLDINLRYINPIKREANLFCYQYSQLGMDIYLANLEKIKPPNPDSCIVFTYDSEDDEKFIYYKHYTEINSLCYKYFYNHAILSSLPPRVRRSRKGPKYKLHGQGDTDLVLSNMEYDSCEEFHDFEVLPVQIPVDPTLWTTVCTENPPPIKYRLN